MSDFLLYLNLGFEHIADIQGYDHILFIIALAAVYKVSQWRDLVWQITAFTAGHSISLILAINGIISANSAWIEFLIPCTIVLASAINVAKRRDSGIKAGGFSKYGLTLGFGLIHGMGFSSFLQNLLGGEESLIVPLLGFNVGLEIGQLVILGLILVITYVVLEIVRMKQTDWVLLISGATGGVSLIMMLERIP